MKINFVALNEKKEIIASAETIGELKGYEIIAYVSRDMASDLTNDGYLTFVTENELIKLRKKRFDKRFIISMVILLIGIVIFNVFFDVKIHLKIAISFWTMVLYTTVMVAIFKKE